MDILIESGLDVFALGWLEKRSGASQEEGKETNGAVDKAQIGVLKGEWGQYV